jgi:hypothetical protein
VGGWSTPHPGRFTPGDDTTPIVQEAGQAPVSVWTGAENLTSTGIRFPDLPARSEALYRLTYRGSFPLSVFKKKLRSRRYICLSASFKATTTGRIFP